MQKYLITTVSALALVFGAAAMAAAQDRMAPGAQDPAAANPGATMPGKEAPAAGAIQHKGGLPTDPGLQPGSRTTASPHASGGGDSGSFKSYSDNKDNLPAATVAAGLPADEAIGAKVRSTSGDTVGEIDDLLIDSNNQISKAIVEVGGFLGIGAKHVAVDVAMLQQSASEKGLVTNMTKEQLKTLPEYKKAKGGWVRSYD